ncbi:MAG: N-acyl homoserine lactonase family protein [Gammaproteobacteria bacterium]|nr:N-acyl homoserine lactonase family protein [Gammaproteobacteria bacterium]MBI5616900.1 N-acyl homoserine lactonase family protein [Gammaproteobacteria bacterium]
MHEDVYDVYAIEYARSVRPSRDYFMFPDPHDGPLPIAYYVWLVRNARRTIVVDTGFSAAAAAQRKRELVRDPLDGLAALGVAAHAAEQVVLTHVHYDHAGNCARFPKAEFVIQEEELRYATGPAMRHRICRAPFEANDVADLVRANFEGRVKFVNGDTTIAPGVSVHLLGGHSGGLQAVRVNTSRGALVLASDAMHFYDQLVLDNPFPIVVDMPRLLAAGERIQTLAPGPDHLIPGHDPAVLALFPRAAGQTGIVELSAAPLAPSPLHGHGRWAR